MLLQATATVYTKTFGYSWSLNLSTRNTPSSVPFRGGLVLALQIALSMVRKV